jgi:hypothetical protein
VNEGVPRATFFVARKVTVPGVGRNVNRKRTRQVRFRIVVVVKVKLHLAEAVSREPPQAVEKRRMVLLAGKEESVPRRQTVGVAKFAGELGVALLP